MIVGVDTWAWPSRDYGGEMGSIGLCAVLVQGTNNDLACYVGQGNPEWVALRGSKVSLAEAGLHFPGLAKILQDRGLTYRGPK